MLFRCNWRQEQGNVFGGSIGRDRVRRLNVVHVLSFATIHGTYKENLSR